MSTLKLSVFWSRRIGSNKEVDLPGRGRNFHRNCFEHQTIRCFSQNTTRPCRLYLRHVAAMGTSRRGAKGIAATCAGALRCSKVDGAMWTKNPDHRGCCQNVPRFLGLFDDGFWGILWDSASSTIALG